ncbi:hypothetical protein MAR_020038, partial [Mya arenaria]
MHIVSGATQLTLGVANGVSLFSEMCMFLVVFRILERTGCFLFMGLGLLGYTVRFIAFATIENPWIVLPFEVLQVENFGARVTFWMFAAGSFVNAVAFLIIQR